MAESTPARRSSLGFFLALALILLALPVGYFLFLGRASPEPAVPPPPSSEPAPARPVELTLREVEGGVEVRRGAGPWEAADAGTVLGAADGVRTLPTGRAVLAGGEAYEVTMEPGTEVSISELSASISKLMLESGMASASVRGAAKHTFEVRARGSDAVATTQAGAFAITNNGQGTVAVGTREGELQFQGGGKTVIVRAGQQSIVRPGQGPTEPAPIPSTLLLKVTLPDAAVLNRKRLKLSGQVEPGAVVELSGTTLRPDAEGRFEHELTLKEGENPISIRAKAVGGRAQQSHHKVTVDTTVRKPSIDPGLWDDPAPAR